MANDPNLPQNGSSNLVEVLEKVLDKGVVIAGDIRVGIADVELLSIKIRLIVASVDKAKEIGLDWWETDPYLTSRATENKMNQQKDLESENQELLNKIEALESKINENALSQDTKVEEPATAKNGGQKDEAKGEGKDN
ncbi:gas vesicle protein [Staphylococcus hyicus]|uniref:Gas vesicle protein n=1 Tax=Staphylococcus hyicus TaxID=1284 RepID=A0A0A8HLJ7_STAHY|nr:gas vesicle protein GvpJ [Staphylococcus hyicus]MCE5154203.1 gas vesicle protein [Staphylococcus hyicus]NJH80417.1 gas vesicle protein [Staphylococcus hyicus]NJH99282.1 gas vesicle protein [Staphylococcus hyicus]NJI30544.1 gas vesicle protein [Staphylococcus hyicus]